MTLHPATLVCEERRPAFLPKLFAVPMLIVAENTVYAMMDPVSYTHLDVYKRQALCQRPIRYGPAKHFHRLRAPINLNLGKTLTGTRTIKTYDKSGRAGTSFFPVTSS